VAYDEFFTIRKCPEESLPALSSQAKKAMANIQQLRPSTLDLKTSDDELSCMAMMHALGNEYKHFTSSLTLLMDLVKVKVKAAFQTEEINHCPRPDASPPSSALSTSIPTCHCDPSSSCAFGDNTGHCQCECYALQCAKETFKLSNCTGRQPKQANTTSTTPGLSLTMSQFGYSGCGGTCWQCKSSFH
jgi:hypothetical protein